MRDSLDDDAVDDEDELRLEDMPLLVFVETSTGESGGVAELDDANFAELLVLETGTDLEVEQESTGSMVAAVEDAVRCTRVQTVSLTCPCCYVR